MSQIRTPRLVIIETGVANLASVRALAERLGLQPIVTSDPEEVIRAHFVLLPGVGAFGPAMQKLRERGLDAAIRSRIAEGRPTAGICLGMQLFFETSEESEGVEGLGLLPGKVKRLSGGLPLPQLGWNRIEPEPGSRLLQAGWVYFANSYGVSIEQNSGEKAADTGKTGSLRFDSISIATTSYGSPFISAIEARRDDRPFLLLCQFHPELSGSFGKNLFSRWLELAGERRHA
jgi:imidazole glycerol phosphate synthase glutamine amidotransferase subunit